MGERCVCRKCENCPCQRTLWLSSGVLGVTRFAKGFLPGPAKTSWVFIPLSPKTCLFLSSFSPPLLAAGASPRLRTGTAMYPFLQSLPPCHWLWVRHLVGEPRGGHGMGLCDGDLGRRWTRARGRDTHLTSLDASGKHSLPLCPFWHHPTW